MEVQREERVSPLRPGATLRLQIPPEPRYARYVRERVMGFASSYNLDSDDLRDFLTALGEALANSMEHAASAEAIEVTCWLVGDDQFLATVVDKGKGFVMTCPELEPRLPGVEAERGRGLPIMRRCTDIFAVRSEPGKGTSVILGRYLRRPDRIETAS
jgi:anti-sigma regulatory factor (Ser/Thr protein kinase)